MKQSPIIITILWTVILHPTQKLSHATDGYIDVYQSDSKTIDGSNPALNIARDAIAAQSMRLQIISENIANAYTTGTTSGEDPYRRKVVLFRPKTENGTVNSVEIAKIVEDKSPFTLRYQPNHPLADANGYVKYPNINTIVEMSDAKEANASIQANIASWEISNKSQNSIIGLLK